MADVSGRDPAQLFVVGALVIATLLVVLALFLNSGIYSENLAARNADPGVDGAVEYRSTAIEAVGNSMYLEANRAPGNSTYASVTANHSGDIRAFSNGSRLYSTYRSELRATEQTSQVNGTYLTQNTSAGLTDAQGDTTWTLVEENDRTRNFSVYVREDSLAEEQLANLLSNDRLFNVTIDASGGMTSGPVYNVSIYNDDDIGDSTNVAVAVYEDDSQQGSTCVADVSIAAALYEVDLTTGEVNGEECGPLGQVFLDILSNNYDYTIRLSNVDQDGTGTVEGRFGLVVDSNYGSSANFNSTRVTPNYATPGPDDPWRSRAVYSSEIDLVYRSNQVSYNETVTVAPGEPS